jgi:hypothetical protein
MLLSNLNLLATAPSGVARLRELILTLAVQGKLVPQDSADEPASELLKKIRVEKDRLMAEGKIKRDKPLAEISEEEKPFELPKGWEWVRLNALLQKIGAGSTPLGGREVYTQKWRGRLFLPTTCYSTLPAPRLVGAQSCPAILMRPMLASTSPLSAQCFLR